MMDAESMAAASLWTSMAKIFTPTILFCLLNLMIATIFIISNFKPQKKKQPSEAADPGRLTRSSSLLQRFGSFNFNLFHSDHPGSHPSEAHYSGTYINQAQITRAPSLIERVKSFNFSLYSSEQPGHSSPAQHENRQEEPPENEKDKPDEPSEITNSSHSVGSDSQVTQTDAVTFSEAPAKMKKSASEKRMPAKTREEEEEECRRPATVREKKWNWKETGPSGKDVDDLAADFISKFRQQLKLQRLDSILRYKERRVGR